MEAEKRDLAEDVSCLELPPVPEGLQRAAFLAVRREAGRREGREEGGIGREGRREEGGCRRERKGEELADVRRVMSGGACVWRCGDDGGCGRAVASPMAVLPFVLLYCMTQLPHVRVCVPAGGHVRPDGAHPVHRPGGGAQEPGGAGEGGGRVGRKERIGDGVGLELGLRSTTAAAAAATAA